MCISRHGIRATLPENVRLVPGPGCPVCVTSVDGFLCPGHVSTILGAKAYAGIPSRGCAAYHACSVT